MSSHSLLQENLPNSRTEPGSPALQGFPGSSADKESACNAGDPGSIPGLGSSPGEGIGCPLQYSWTSLVVQMVKHPPAMWETWVRPLGWKIPWRRAWQATAVFASILAWRIPTARGAWWATAHGAAKSRTRWSKQAQRSTHALQADSLQSEPPGKPLVTKPRQLAVEAGLP